MSAAPETLPVASESRTRAPATAVSVPPPPVAAPPPPHRTKHVVHWFRKGLRLHDNPALREGLKDAVTFRCVFIIDPWFASSSNVGINKWRFLLQCLQDLDTSLKQLNSRLYVVRGQPADALPKLFKDWGTTTLSFEEDPEPYGRVRDHNITTKCREVGINVISHVSHTLYKLDSIIELNGGKAPLTYHQFQALIASIPPPPQAEASISLQTLNGTITPVSDDHDERFGVPSLEELGFDTDGLKQPVWIGGESEALARLERHLERKAWVASFGRPKMTPQSLLASQTGLSPYLRFGCLSTRLFYYQLTGLYMRVKQVRPPLSLHGQILWREFFYCAATRNPNFDRMEGNPICVQIPWDKNQEALAKWANGQTGFPWIDSIMVQLRDEGWIHHLARHAVACFLTRGDLWISWEEGMKEDPELSTEVDFLNERHRDLITIRDITNAPGTSDALDVQSYFVTKPTTTNAVIAQSDFTAGIENIYSTVFDELLLDADWSVNAGMWMWLSCSSFFQQFFHCYCPVRFGRKTDPNGDFIRRYIPALKNMPTRYIHEPWVAPEAVQVSARCIIGRDYPLPMVDHAKASHVNIERIKQVYAQLAKYKPQGNLNPNPVARPNMMQSSPSPTSIITSINQSNFLCSQTPEPQVTSTPTLISYNDDSVFQHPGKTATDKPTIKHVFIAQNTEKTKTTKNAKETPSPPSNRDGFTNQQTQDAANQVSFKANQGNEPQSQGKEKFAFKNYAINATNFVNQNYAAANELFRAQQLTRNKIIYAQQEVKFNSFDDEKVKFCMSALSENDIKVESGFIHSEVMQQRYIAAPLSQNYNTKKNPVSNNGKDQLKSTEGSLIQTINSDKTFPHAVHNNQTSSNENKPEDKGNTD